MARFAALVVAALAAGLVLAPVPARAAPMTGAPRDLKPLVTTLEHLVSTTALSRARVSIKVVDLETGELVYAKNPDDLLNPASNVKLFTSAAALVRLGSEYRFDTEFLFDKGKGIRAGNVRGPLYVRGRGDPSITSEKLFGIVRDLRLAGLRSVGGDLVLDDSWFDEQSVGPGFDQEHSDRSYLAPAGALSLNWNTIGVTVVPGASAGAHATVTLESPSDYFVVENRVVTGKPRSLRRLFVSSQPMGERQRIVVSGRIPLGHSASAVWKKIDHPTLYFGHSLKALLAQNGIEVRGKVRRGVTPEDAQSLLLHQSDTLDLVLKRVNKNSSNFTTEQLVKTLGAVNAGPPGSWRNGIAAIEDFLARDVGIGRGTYVMKNGSGLNDTNRFSASQICKLLRHMYQRFPIAPEYLSSLGIAGKDGTLHYRMENSEAVGRLRAKTGTLESVSALSGYVESVGGARFAFALVVNDFPGRSGPIVNSLDLLGGAIAAYGAPTAPPAVVQASATVGTSPLGELRARLATYEGLGNKRDPRNLKFLRTALNAETDPALKAVVADAVYRSAPDEYGSARAFVDHFAASRECFGRLRTLAVEDGIPTPLIGSLAEIAGDGNLEAISRLLEVAALARGDQALAQELLTPLSEVLTNASDEAIAALAAAPAITRESALEVIAKSLVASGEAVHPFPEALKKMAGSPDPSVADASRVLEQALSKHLAAERAAMKIASPAVAPGGSSPVQPR